MSFSNSQYNEIMREYEAMQAEQRAKLERRLEEVYEKIPEMKELNAQASGSALRRYKEYMRSKDRSAMDGFGAEIDEIKAKKAQLLEMNGFAPNYMEMEYNCSICKDTGMTQTGRCRCFNARLISKLYEKSNIRPILERENFENFNLEYFDNERQITSTGLTAREYMKKVLENCKNFVRDFDVKKTNLLFMGNTGVGKSFLSNSIAKELLDTYHSALYLTSSQLFEHLQKARIERSDEEEELLINDYVDTCELLIIDDLGTESPNSWTSSQLFRIINNRINEDKSTIISTNLSMNMIRDIYSERLSSRLMSLYKVIMLYGDDIRIKSRKIGGRDVKSD